MEAFSMPKTRAQVRLEQHVRAQASLHGLIAAISPGNQHTMLAGQRLR